LVHNYARKALKKLVLSLFICSAAAMHHSGDGPLALKMWIGWPTFPMIFVDQTLVGGSKHLQRLLNDGKLAVDKVNA